MDFPISYDRNTHHHVEREFSTLLGLTLTSLVRDTEYDALLFTTDTGRQFAQYHEQDCCEAVYIEDIDGDLDDLVGAPILLAEETSSPAEIRPDHDAHGSHTGASWTFYKLATIKGGATVRWYSASNGCYSEEAPLYEIVAYTPEELAEQAERKARWKARQEYLASPEYKDMEDNGLFLYIREPIVANDDGAVVIGDDAEAWGGSYETWGWLPCRQGNIYTYSETRCGNVPEGGAWVRVDRKYPNLRAARWETIRSPEVRDWRTKDDLGLTDIV